MSLADRESMITIEVFKRRLEALCLGQGGRGLPRKRRDQQILLKSITLLLEVDQEYSEREVNQILERWLAEVGRAIEIDYVTLRRHLVDGGYLIRDRAGRSYRLHPEETAGLFEPETDTIDPVAVVEAAQKRIAQKKQDYLARNK